jgi:hypothetical protein
MTRLMPMSRAVVGLIVAPLLWACNTQAGQILPYADCGTAIRLAAIFPLVSAILAAAGGYVSWTAVATGSGKRPTRFVALLGALAGLLFAFALALQGTAGLILTGCER